MYRMRWRLAYAIVQTHSTKPVPNSPHAPSRLPVHATAVAMSRGTVNAASSTGISTNQFSRMFLSTVATSVHRSAETTLVLGAR